MQRTSAASLVFPPGLIDNSESEMRQRPISVVLGRPLWSKRTDLPRVRALSSRTRWRRRRAQLTPFCPQERRSWSRSSTRARRSHSSLYATALPLFLSLARKITSAWGMGIRGRIPAEWAPILRRL